MTNIDIVIHLAAKHRFFGVQEREYHLVNTEGTKNVLNAMNLRGVNKLIFFSTVAVYGEQDRPTDETSEENATTPYGISKLAAESLIKKWVNADSNKRAIIIRPTVVFGPNNRGNIYRLIRQIYYRAYLPVGSGENIKSVAYVENLVDATIFLMGLELNRLEIFNYSDAPHMTYKEIVTKIYAYLGRKYPAYELPVVPMMKLASVIDFFIKKARFDFSIETFIQKINKSTHHKAGKIISKGFRPAYSAQDGLQKMLKWYVETKNSKMEAGCYE